MITAKDLTADLQRAWRHGEHVDARGLVLDEPLVLDGMCLRGVDLSGAHLNAGLSARGATFRGLAWLRDTLIEGPCDFTGAEFRIDLRCEGMKADEVRLDDVQVRGVLALARVHARRIGMARALVMANLTLEAAAVSDLVDLSEAVVMGGFWADGARIGRILDKGAEIDGRVRLPGGAL